MRRMARGALLGARGNSGVIVSQILRGMADSFATSVAVRGGELARALRIATEAAYGAVARPVEGTVLSVVAAAAEGAGRIKSDDLLAVARAAARSATEALARTPQQLPALARAGVVDAGGRGLCLLLDALVDALGRDRPTLATPLPTRPDPPAADSRDGRRRAAAPRPATGAEPPSPSLRAPSRRAPSGARPSDGAVEGPERSRAEATVASATRCNICSMPRTAPSTDCGVRSTRLGDSLVVVGTGEGDPPTWNVHVHVPAANIGAGGRGGRRRRPAVPDQRHAVG